MVAERPLTRAGSHFDEVLDQAGLTPELRLIAEQAAAEACQPNDLFNAGPSVHSQTMIERCERAIEEHKQKGQKVPKQTVAELRHWQRANRIARRREELDAERQRIWPGCLCLGFGGRGALGPLRVKAPDGAILADHDLETFRDPCGCPLGVEQQTHVERRTSELLAERQRFRIGKLWSDLKMPSGLGETITFETHPDQAVMGRIQRWYGRSYRPGLVMTGPNQRGKTTTARLLARQAIYDGLGVIGNNMPSLIERLTETFDHDQRLRGDPDHPPQTSHADLIISLQNVEFLLLDDLGAEKGSEYVERALYQILDARCDNSLDEQGRICRLLIITTNLTVPELMSRFGGRIWARMTKLCHFVEFTNDMIGPAADGPTELPTAVPDDLPF